jgi:hypothetical protein
VRGRHVRSSDRSISTRISAVEGISRGVDGDIARLIQGSESIERGGGARSLGAGVSTQAPATIDGGCRAIHGGIRREGGPIR